LNRNERSHENQPMMRQSSGPEWSRIERWLQRNSPKGLSGLRAAASGADLAGVVSTTGLSIPESLRSMLGTHDGQESPSIFGRDFDFLSSRQMAEHWGMHVTVLSHLPADEPSGDFDPEVMVQCDRGVKPLIASRKWLPFADSNGDVTLYIDFDPAPGGRVGQVIEVDPEGTVWRVLASSFDIYLSERLRQLEAGGG
jgi:cell wall assembly regulator SMI1